MPLILGLLFAFTAVAEPNQFSLTAGGDVMFGRYSEAGYREVGGANPFAMISGELSRSDLSFVNLESPLMDGHPARRPTAPRGLVFRGEAYRAQQLVDAGVDVVTLANNHTEDLRMAGVQSSLEILEQVGLASFGAAAEGDPFAPAVLEHEGIPVLFFGATTRRNLGEPGKDQWIPSAYRHWRWLKDEMPARVRKAREEFPNALIFVSMHWGEEYVTSAPREHQRLAHTVIDAGANGVLGHHPHVLQPVEVYRGAPILYSMGNLVFDQRGLSKRRSALFTMEWTRSATDGWQLAGLELIPLMLPGGHDGPSLASPEQARPILDGAIQGARAQGTALTERNGRLYWRPASQPDSD